MKNKNLNVMVETAVLVALSLLLSLITFWKMPQGGSVSLEMLPIFVLAFRRGGKVGMAGGALLGLLKLLINPYILHPIQVIFDYPLPFALLGVGGFVKGSRLLGVIVGSFLRYVTHVISGVAFFAEYAPEGTPALLYSMSYNASYLIVEAILVAIVIHLLSKRREIFEPTL